jgi:ketosteroid isomerase-like protein
MSIEENKNLVRQFMDCFNHGDLAGALNLMGEDATWWIAGRPEQLPAAGLYDKEKIGRLLVNMGSQLADGLKMTIKNILAEGDRVALEAESYGALQNGRIYNQQYHFLMTIQDGKIAAIKEYLDTQHVYATWFQQ